MAYDLSLLDRPEIIVLTKMDLPESAEKADVVGQVFIDKGLDVLKISSVTHEGLEDLKQTIYQKLSSMGADE